MSGDLHPRRSAAADDVDMKEKPKKRRGLKWFVVDLWWLHLIVALIVGLIVTLIVTYVVYPKIARSQVKSATLTLQDLQISNPTPNSVHVNITAKLTSKSPFKPALKPFNGTLVLPDGTPFLTIPIPRVAVKNGRLINTNADIPITPEQLPGFTRFAVDLVKNETITTSLTGKGQLQLGKLPNVEVTYDKPLTVKGFDGLKGVTLGEPSILLTQQPDGASLVVKVTIPNPSIQTVQLGDLVLDIAVPASALGAKEDMPLGYATVNDTTLKPGDNTFDSRSVANQTLLINLLLAHREFYEKGLPVKLTGRDAYFNGVRIDYLSTALGAAPVTQTLDIGTAINNAGLGGIFTNTAGSPATSSPPQKRARGLEETSTEADGSSTAKRQEREGESSNDEALIESRQQVWYPGPGGDIIEEPTSSRVMRRVKRAVASTVWYPGPAAIIDESTSSSKSRRQDNEVRAPGPTAIIDGTTFSRAIRRVKRAVASTVWYPGPDAIIDESTSSSKT